jgi:hypothetical protein
LLRLQPAFVESAAAHEQLEWIAADDNTVVAARAQGPSAAMEIATGLDEIGDFMIERIWNGHFVSIERVKTRSTSGLSCDKIVTCLLFKPC